MTENEIARVIVDPAFEVHRTLGGPGLLEAVYEEALAFELESRGHPSRGERAARVNIQSFLRLCASAPLR